MKLRHQAERRKKQAETRFRAGGFSCEGRYPDQKGTSSNEPISCQAQLLAVRSNKQAETSLGQHDISSQWYTLNSPSNVVELNKNASNFDSLARIREKLRDARTAVARMDESHGSQSLKPFFWNAYRGLGFSVFRTGAFRVQV